MVPQTPFIQRLTVYPVKGLRGIDVEQARITPFGLQDDRRYMLVDATGCFISQRKHPALTQFEVAFADEHRLEITHEGHGTIALLRHPDATDAKRHEVLVWGDQVQAAATPSEADAFFSDVLGEAVRLVWMPADAERMADPAWAPPGSRVSFADGFPVLILGAASVDELNTRLVTPVSVRRFRANVVIGGAAPWAEDDWKVLETDDARFELVKPCARCVVIATDQQTGQRTREPSATLATYRVRGGKVMVGMNAVADPVGGVVDVGQSVRVI
jgi:uncharacterized protein YcbX